MTPEALAALHATCFERAWTAQEFARLLEADSSVLVTRQEGFALARVLADEAEILSLATAPADRNRGIGSVILLELIDKLCRRGASVVFLEVAEDNAPARALYHRAGFSRVGLRPAYYPRSNDTAADALVLARKLQPDDEF